MMPTTPIGSRVISTSTPGRTDGSFSPPDAQRLAGEELEDLAGARRLADAFGQGLALLARQQLARARPCARGSRCRCASSDVGALLRRRPRTRPGTPPCAAAIAASAWAASACAYSPTTSSVFGRVDVAVDRVALHPLAGDEVLIERQSPRFRKAREGTAVFPAGPGASSVPPRRGQLCDCLGPDHNRYVSSGVFAMPMQTIRVRFATNPATA